MLRRIVSLAVGEPAPWFHQRSTSNPNYSFDLAGGYYVVMCFLGSASSSPSKSAVDALLKHRAVFDDRDFCFFGVSLDPSDEAQSRLKQMMPGIRYFWDFDGLVSRSYGSIPLDSQVGEATPYRRFWLVLDPTLRVLRTFYFDDETFDHEQVFAYLAALPPREKFTGISLQAPVLYLPNVFEPSFCADLIDRFRKRGGEESGFMREVGGKTIGLVDRTHKSRKDCYIEGEDIRHEIQIRIKRRICPEIQKAFQFRVSRMERYVVACYAAEDGGHFRAHRDNTTKGTAHRRFAVSINLNSDYDGGTISFPEYGSNQFKPPVGGALVFSCSLLHEVERVTRGERYAFLPFLYDEAAAAIRLSNNPHLAPEIGEYKLTSAF